MYFQNKEANYFTELLFNSSNILPCWSIHKQLKMFQGTTFDSEVIYVTKLIYLKTTEHVLLAI